MDETMGHYLFGEGYSEYNDEYDPYIEEVEDSEPFKVVSHYLDYFLSIYTNEDKFLDAWQKHKYGPEYSDYTTSQLFKLINIEVDYRFVIDSFFTIAFDFVFPKRKKINVIDSKINEFCMQAACPEISINIIQEVLEQE